MKTRLLRPEENWKSNLTMAVAFEGDYDLEKAKESAARERTEEEKREDAYCPGNKRSRRRARRSHLEAVD